MPTVAEKVPGWNLPVSNCTRSEVLPTPESPSRMVCVEEEGVKLVVVVTV